jgi:serine/threonine protein kinase/tetratricopeptide (TPR) repeat protein
MTITCPKCRTENSQDSKFCRECATPLPIPHAEAATAATVTAGGPGAGLASGSTFAGRYQIVEELGRGGMGRVYKALDTRIGEKVALKLVRTDIASDPRIAERFANEIRLARQITHRNICRVYDLNEEADALYISMEYVSGEDLKSMLRMTGGLSPAQTVSIARQIASGLAEAHRLGVIHRDLKPHNIMIDRQGTARIMDFGIAFSDATRGLTGGGVIIGTPEYMSPEQAEGEDVDARSDIYSLGIMLFEMVTGKLPFEGRSPLAIAMKQKGEPPPNPTDVNPRVPFELSTLILKCLAKSKAERFQSAEELGAELDRLGAEFPATIPPVSGKASTPSAAAVRRPLPRAAIVSAVLILAIACGFAVWLLFRSRPSGAGAGSTRLPNSVAVIGFDNQTGDPRYEHLRKAIPSLLITSLENTGRFKVVTWERMRDVLAQGGRKDVDIIDSEGGFDVCRREGIAFIVTGSFMKAGEIFATDVKVLSAESRAMVKSATSRGEGENSILRTQIDELGREIAGGLALSAVAPVPLVDGISPGQVRSPQVIDVTTTSMDAYTAYLRGRDALQRFRYDEAIKALRHAIEVDPEFASAHYYLSRVYGASGDRIGRDQELKLSKQYSVKCTDRERLYIDANYAGFIERNQDKRIGILKDIVTRFPGDKTGFNDLGLALFNQSKFSEAAQAYEHALELDPAFGAALNGISPIYFELGKPDLAVQCLQKYAAINPADGNPWDSMGDLQMRLGRLDDAKSSFRRALEIQPDIGSDFFLAAIAAMEEDFDAAFRWIDSLMQHATAESRKAEAHAMRALLFQLTGRTDAARAPLTSCGEIFTRAGTPQISHFLAGSICYDSGAWEESRREFQAASKASSSLAAYAVIVPIALGYLDCEERKAPFSRTLSEQLLAATTMPGFRSAVTKIRALQAGSLALEGKLDEAVALLAPAWPGPMWQASFASLMFYNFPLQQDTLAQLYFRKGDLDRAVAEYKVLTVIGPAHTNRRFVHPLYHYRLAQVYEKKGATAEAVAEYERFQKLWQKADPHRPELVDTRTRLARLKKL